MKLNVDGRQAVECHIDEVNQTGTVKTELINIEQTKDAALPGSYDGLPLLGQDGSVFRHINTDTTGNVQVKVINGSQRVPVNVNQIDGATLSLDTTTASASLPVTVASDEARIRTSNGIVEYYPDLGTGFDTSGMTIGSVGTGSRQNFQCCSRLRVETDGDIAYIYSDPLGIQNGVPVEFEGTFNQNHTDIETLRPSATPSDGILIVQDGNLDLEIRQMQGATIITTTAVNFDVDIGNIQAQDWHDFKIVIYPTAAPVFKFYYRSSTQPDWYLFHTIYAREDNNSFWFNSVANMRVYARCTGITVLEVKWTDINTLNVYQGRDAGIPAPVTDLSKYETHFNQLMVAEETPVLQYTFNRNINNRIFGTFTSGSPQINYVSTDGGSAQIKLDTGHVGTAGVWSKETVNYRNGQMAVARFTSKIFNSGALGASCSMIVGIGDRLDANSFPDNGIFFNLDENGLGCLVRRDGTDAYNVPLSTIDGDVFDVDTTTGQYYYIYEIRFSYLGAYGCEWRIYNTQTARWHIVGKFQGLDTRPFTYNSNMSWLMVATSFGTPTGAVTIDTHSIYLGIVGKSRPNLEPRSVFSTQTGLGDGSEFLGIRNVTTYASKDNFGRIYLKSVQVSVQNGGSNVSSILVYKNPTWGVPLMANLVALDTANSIIEYSENPGNLYVDVGVLVAALNLSSSGSDHIEFSDITLAPDEELLFILRTTLSTAVNISVLLHEDL